MVHTPSPTWYAAAGNIGSHPKYCAIPYAAVAAPATLMTRSSMLARRACAEIDHARITTPAWPSAPNWRQCVPRKESAGSRLSAVESASQPRVSAASSVNRERRTGISDTPAAKSNTITFGVTSK